MQFGVAELEGGVFAVLGVTPEGDGSVIAGFSEKRLARRAASRLLQAVEVPILADDLLDALKRAPQAPVEPDALVIAPGTSALHRVVHRSTAGEVTIAAFGSLVEAEAARDALRPAVWLRIP